MDHFNQVITVYELLVRQSHMTESESNNPVNHNSQFHRSKPLCPVEPCTTVELEIFLEMF